MKTRYPFLFTAFLFTGFANAQVVITDIQPEFGDQFTLHQSEDQTDPGPSGADVTWNYPSLTTSYIADYTISSPVGAPGSDLFPGSSIVWQANISGIAYFNGFFSFENGEMVDLGYYNDSGGQIVTRIFSDPLTLYQYPILYGNSGSDSFSGVLDIGGWNTANYEGNYSYVADAYGTITTPFGTFNDVLRVQATQVQSTYIGITEDVTIEYFWFTAEYPVPIMVVSSTESFFMGESEEIEYFTSYISDYSFATSVSNNDMPPLNFFPNPAQNQITIQSDFEGLAQLNIYTIDGKKAAQQSIQNNERIDVSNLSPGFYIAEVSIDGNTYTKANFVIAQ